MAVTISARFNGPPGPAAHGGLAARFVGPPGTAACGGLAAAPGASA
jgi:hypothetical protein